MEDNRKASERHVLRSSEGHRLEEQLLTMAYEQIRPVIRRRRKQPAATRQNEHVHERIDRTTQKARRA